METQQNKHSTMSSPATGNPATDNPAIIDIGTSKLSYRRTGRGPDLVFLHGWPVHKETWRNVAEALPDFTCHLFDFPGCGETATLKNQPVSIEGHVEATLRAVDELGLTSFVLIGQDSGGLIARIAAHRLGDRVEALILTGTEMAGHHPEMIARLQTAVRLPGAATVTRKLLGSHRLAKSPNLLGGCFWDRDLINGEFRTAVIEPMLADPDKVRRQIEIIKNYDEAILDTLPPLHAELTCPTLIIWGERDPFFPVELARKMAEEFGGPTTFLTYEKARLLVYEEYPERFADDCRNFLLGLQSGDGERQHPSDS